jgi:hypothetical protein
LAADILNTYQQLYNKADNDDYWANQHSIYAIDIRIKIEQSSSIYEKIPLFKELQQKQKEALYNIPPHLEAYANLIAAEMALISKFINVDHSLASRFYMLRRDSVLDQFPYIKEVVNKLNTGQKDHDTLW